MGMNITDRILGPARGSIAAANRAILNRPNTKRRPDVEDYLDEVFRLAPLVGMDPAIIVAQAVHETGWFTSRWWADRLNVAGIGITGDPAQNEASGRWESGTDAARAQIVHMIAYVYGDSFLTSPLSVTPSPISDYIHLDPRLQAVFAANFDGAVRTIADLTGRWAVDAVEPNDPLTYAEKIAAVGNRVFPGIPDQRQEQSRMTIPTTYSVPTPTIYNLATDYARFGLTQGQAQEIIGSRFPNRNGGAPRFIVYHIQDGTTQGSLTYWASNQVDASSTVMVQKDGSVLRIVPEIHGPWTNGDVRSPTWQANSILALGGTPNNWSLTIEAEGRPWDAMPPAQRDAILWVSEDWLMRYPAILDVEWCLLRHAFINSVTRQNCPGVYFDPIVAGINAWLDGAVVMPEPEPEPTPAPPPSPYPRGMTPALARRLYGTLTVPWASRPFGFDLKRSECRFWLAHGTAKLPEGADYTAGMWPQLTDCIRRGDGKVRTFQWSNGLVYEQVVKGI